MAMTQDQIKTVLRDLNAAVQKSGQEDATVTWNDDGVERWETVKVFELDMIRGYIDAKVYSGSEVDIAFEDIIQISRG